MSVIPHWAWIDSLMAENNGALKEARLNFKGTVKTLHMVEVLVEDIGFEASKHPSSSRWKK